VAYVYKYAYVIKEICLTASIPHSILDFNIAKLQRWLIPLQHTVFALAIKEHSLTEPFPTSFPQAYQHLFYLLQTNPSYFAKLIFEMPQNRTNRFMENVILTVFNYAQNNREQYLLVKLFDTALNEEIK